MGIQGPIDEFAFMITIAEYLSKQRVHFLKASDRDEVIGFLVDSLGESGLLLDKEAFYQAIMDREKIVSTGIGMGVAIPHAKLPIYDDFFIAIAVLKEGVDWNALDEAPVRIVFMVGGPDDKQTQYLQILSMLTMAVKDEECRKKLLQMDTAEAVVQLFETV